MKFVLIFACCTSLFTAALSAQAPRQELAFTLGSFSKQTRESGNTPITIGSGSALQANYAVRIFGGDAVGLYLGAHLLASPNRKVDSLNTLVTRDFASLFLTPHLTLKLAPGSRISPWGTFGGGYALYEQSTTTLSGLLNPAARHVTKSTWMYGGGLDIKLVGWLALRGEIRDFYSGNPTLNLPVQGKPHNLVYSGGFVLRF